jgi:hypothetical protein
MEGGIWPDILGRGDGGELSVRRRADRFVSSAWCCFFVAAVFVDAPE